MRCVKIYLALFLMLSATGIFIACRRPLWNDEFYSLTTSTLGFSYQAIWKGSVGEGNNSPLFYIIQKLLCDAFHYQPPAGWIDEHWGGDRPFDRMFLRAYPILVLAAAVAAVFCFFARRYGWPAGVYAMAVLMTSSLFWEHWTEARPYAVWFALSLFQILLLLSLFEAPADKKKSGLLAAVHVLLALVSTISIIQITAAAVTLAFRLRRPWWYIWSWALPSAICVYYYWHTPHFSFFFVNSPLELINANVPKDRLAIIAAGALIILICRKRNVLETVEAQYLVFFACMMAAFGLDLAVLHARQTVNQGFWISSRYFLSLTPAGSVAVVLCSIRALGAFPQKACKILIAMILLVCLIFRGHKMLQQVPLSKWVGFKILRTH